MFIPSAIQFPPSREESHPLEQLHNNNTSPAFVVRTPQLLCSPDQQWTGLYGFGQGCNPSSVVKETEALFVSNTKRGRIPGGGWQSISASRKNKNVCISRGKKGNPGGEIPKARFSEMQKTLQTGQFFMVERYQGINFREKGRPGWVRTQAQGFSGSRRLRRRVCKSTTHPKFRPLHGETGNASTHLPMAPLKSSRLQGEGGVRDLCSEDHVLEGWGGMVRDAAIWSGVIPINSLNKIQRPQEKKYEINNLGTTSYARYFNPTTLSENIFLKKKSKIERMLVE